MSELQSKCFDEPDEVVSLPNLAGQIVVLGEAYVGRYVHKPGWRWSKDVKPLVGTPSCQYHHQGFVLSGQVHLTTDDGAQRTLGPGEAFNIPPGHDAYVVGDEPCITVEFRGARDWAKPAIGGERVLTTLLVTDIVDSTATATRLGDAEWKKLLARHFDRVRLELDRFRGYEIASIGDGFLAMFDGAARAVRCAASITRIAREDGIEVRVGVHSGEVERHTDNVRGVAVHTVTRIAALASSGEVLLSAPTAALLEGSGLSFSDAGEHKLKGLAGRRRLHRLKADIAVSGHGYPRRIAESSNRRLA
jgi:class 3 adenylate cyclase